MCRGVLQRGAAMQYRVLQCAAVCRSVCMRACEGEHGSGEVCCRVLQCVAVCCSVLQCVAVCGSVVQCVAVCRMRARDCVHRSEELGRDAL